MAIENSHHESVKLLPWFEALGKAFDLESMPQAILFHGQPGIGGGMLYRVTTFVSRSRGSCGISSIKYVWREVDRLICWIVVVRELSLHTSHAHIMDVVVGKHELGDFLPRKVGL